MSRRKTLYGALPKSKRGRGREWGAPPGRKKKARPFGALPKGEKKKRGGLFGIFKPRREKNPRQLSMREYWAARDLLKRQFNEEQLRAYNALPEIEQRSMLANMDEAEWQKVLGDVRSVSELANLMVGLPLTDARVKEVRSRMTQLVVQTDGLRSVQAFIGDMKRVVTDEPAEPTGFAQVGEFIKFLTSTFLK